MKSICFTKMQGLGNNYVYVDVTREKIENPSELSKIVSNVNFGIGSDGLILIGTSSVADFSMHIYNQDGSEAQMCGNGARCVGKYVYEKGLTSKDKITLETLAGIKTLHLEIINNEVASVEVNMGKPNFVPASIPVVTEKSIFQNEELDVNHQKYYGTCVSMGNPHCVIFVDDLSEINLEEVGPVLENLPLFPERINVEFVEIVQRNEVRMLVWERGSGRTMACGTGDSAVVAIGVFNGLLDSNVLVHLEGGDLEVANVNGEILLKGPAVFVCDGNFYF